MQWRYWRWQILRTLPLAIVIFAVVTVAGIGLMRLMPKQQTAISRVVLETPLSLRDTPRAARSSQDVQHLQVVIHNLLSPESLTEIANSLSLSQEQVTRSTILAKINSGRDKPTTLTVEAHAQTAEMARALSAASIQQAIETSGRLQRERIDASLNNLKALVAKHGEVVSVTKDTLTRFDPVEVRVIAAELKDLEGQALRIQAKIDGRSRPKPTKTTALATLERELATARGIYSDRHPKVRLLMSRVAQLLPDAQNAHSSEVDSLHEKLTTVRAGISNARTVQSDFTVATDSLADAERDLEHSQQALIEARLKGEQSVVRLKLVEDATLTTASRLKKQMAAMLFVGLAALALATGAMALRIKFDQKLRRPADLTRTLGLTPFSTIPDLGPSLL